MTAYPEHVKEAVLEYRRQGRTCREIEELTGICRGTQTIWYRKHGLAAPRPALTAEEIATAEAMLADGCSYREVSRTLGRGKHTFARRFPGYGWSSSDGGKFSTHAMRLSQDDLLPSHTSKYDRPSPSTPVRRLTRLEREALVA